MNTKYNDTGKVTHGKCAHCKKFYPRDQITEVTGKTGWLCRSCREKSILSK